MIDLRKVLILLAACGVCFSAATPAMADFVGVVTGFKLDADTLALCVDEGEYGSSALTVCNVSIQFGDDNDRLLSIAFADLQVTGAPGALFNQHAFGEDTPYDCDLLSDYPDLICDSYVAISEKCVGAGGTSLEGDFLTDEFNFNGHIVGGWFNSTGINGLGDAFSPQNPDGKIFVLQAAVAQGLGVEGSATVFWQNIGDPTVFEELVEIVCPIGCIEGESCFDDDVCTQDKGICIHAICMADPLNCDDGNDCTDDSCDPDSGCLNKPNDGPCDDGNACTENDMCGPDGCVEGTPVDCDDGDECTDDSCDPQTGCVNDQVNCDDGDQCTTDSCDPEDGCVHTPDCTADADCDDGLLCTIDDCQGDCCVNIPVECTPGGVCDPDSGTCVVPASGFLDIIPGKCPNRLQRNGLGFLKVSLVSATEADGGPFDACDVDVSTIQLCRADGTAGCAQPTSNPAPRCKDRATPFLGDLCDCHTRRKDGLDDLDLRFKMADVVNNLGLADMPAGVSVELELTALTNDGQNVKARDCVELGRDLGPNP